jgi:predicted transglutaminase-like cysteine proteinase
MGAGKMPMKALGTVVFCAIVALVLFPASASASPIDAGNPAFAAIGGPTSIPIGHAEFCKTHRADCSPNAHVVDMVELDQSRWERLLEINAAVNMAILPETDEALYHIAEFWTYPNGAGDCEDIALAKRRALIADGWSPSDLLMAVVREANGDGHAVLMVRTDRGDLVLDNQDGAVRVWNDTPYQFIKRQSQTDQGRWVDILDDRATIVATAE